MQRPELTQHQRAILYVLDENPEGLTATGVQYAYNAIDRRGTLRVLARLRELNLIHVCAWKAPEKGQKHHWTRIYAPGYAVDAVKPEGPKHG